MFPQIETKRLILTDIHAADASEIFNIFSNKSVVEYYDLEQFSEVSTAEKLIELFRARYTAKLGIRWAIRLKNESTLIGTCGFNSWSESMKSAVIGYDLNASYWGNGYAREAVEGALDFAFFGSLPCGPIHRVQADTVVGNLRSEKLLLRLGFREEGLRRESGHWKGAFHSLKCFGLLEGELTKT